jgi:hypothetical protein
VRPESRDRNFGIGPGQLELDAAIELLEAIVAADLAPHGAEEPTKGLPNIHRYFCVAAAVVLTGVRNQRVGDT